MGGRPEHQGRGLHLVFKNIPRGAPRNAAAGHPCFSKSAEMHYTNKGESRPPGPPVLSGERPKNEDGEVPQGVTDRDKEKRPAAPVKGAPEKSADGGGQDQSGSGNTIAAPIAKKVMEAVLGR